MRLPNFKKLFKKNEQGPSPVNETCKNCQAEFSGHFCPECGQSVKEFDKPFSFVFYNFVGDFFAFDTRFFKTFYYLLFFPGRLTIEFFEGKRVRYAPPFRIFVFVSFILFFLLQIYTNQGLNKILDSSLNDKGIVSIDTASVSVANSALANYNSNHDTVNNNDLISGIGAELLNRSGSMRQLLNIIATFLEEKLEKEQNIEKQAKLKEFIRLCRSPELAWGKMLKYMSWAFFLLLPVFAIILKLFYMRRNQNYIRHLIFSVHLHSFIFSALFFVIILNMIITKLPVLITVLLFLSVPVYFVIALKKFYGQKWRLVISKFLGILMVYNIVFWIAVIFVFIDALNII